MSSTYELDSAFADACDAGNLEEVKRCLAEGADIHFDNDIGITYASRENHLEVVKYLLSSPDLTERVNVNANHGTALRAACTNGNLEMVQYLLRSPNLEQHANPLVCTERLLRKLASMATRISLNTWLWSIISWSRNPY